jgi:hypothetical protein
MANLKVLSCHTLETLRDTMKSAHTPPTSQYILGHFQYIIISLATHLFFCTFLLIMLLLALVVDVSIASKTALPVLITVAI